MCSCRCYWVWTVTWQKWSTRRLLSCLSSPELSHSPEVRPAVVVQLGLSSRGQLEVTHLTQRIRPTLTWREKTSRDEKRKLQGLTSRSIEDMLGHLRMESAGQRDWWAQVWACPSGLDTSLQSQRSAHSPGAEKGWEESSSLQKTRDLLAYWTPLSNPLLV